MSKKEANYLYPTTWQEQKLLLPTNQQDREKIALDLHNQVKEIYQTENISVIQSFYRAKSDLSIYQKLLRRKPLTRNYPIPDLYGSRFIINIDQINPGINIILSRFNPPEIYPWLLTSVIDHRNLKSKSIYSTKSYKAVHLYLPFQSNFNIHLGEIQLLTLDWLKSANRTRRHYEARQQRLLDC